MNKKITILSMGLIALTLMGCVTPAVKSGMTENEAKSIAEANCIKGGESLSPGYYNENSKTWWFDANLNATKEGCNPACVVFEETGDTEINWRCTGAIIPEDEIITDEEPGKEDLIILDSPKPGETIKSPLIVTGKARGYWFFEASFPVVLTNWDGLIIAQGIAQAQGDWMTEEFVPFKAELTFIPDKDVYSKRGALILQKSNPSGLPENDNALEISVVIEE